ncbi:hypothetical protein [Flavobacterium phycosphaerae]|uniref:hypothetical protein n=1 Tax=Flavobacterium phycosphaerae TaxID=2697515 RepID=UPI00138A109B|nr:hypothetical protein [Flavobacterium phycosphaerae]
MIKYLLCWFPMVLMAVVNGAARDLGYKKYVGELAAHQISTFSLLILIFIYSGLIVKWWPPSDEKQALFIGIIWAVLTLLFEFGFGKLRGNTWEQLFRAYNVAEGQLWILIPIGVALAPYIMFKFIVK